MIFGGYFGGYKRKLHHAIDLSDEGHWDEALSALEALVSKYPDRPQPQFERAMVLTNLERDKEAIAALQDVIALDPQYPGAASWLGRLKTDSSEPKDVRDGAGILYQNLAATDPTDWSANGQAWADCASAYLDIDQPEKAVEVILHYRKDFEGKQKGYETYLSTPLRVLAEAYLAIGDTDKALLAAREAVSMEKTVPADHFMLATCLAHVGETQEAIDMVRELATDFEGTLPLQKAERMFEKLGINWRN